MEPHAARAPLLHRRLGEPEDLLVGRRSVRLWILVGLLDDLEVTPLLARPIQDHRHALAIALYGHDRDPLHLVADLERYGRPLLAQAEDVLIGAWPAVAHKEGQDWLKPFASIDSQPIGELRVAASLEHPDPNVWNPADGHTHQHCPGAAYQPASRCESDADRTYALSWQLGLHVRVALDDRCQCFAQSSCLSRHRSFLERTLRTASRQARAVSSLHLLLVAPLALAIHGQFLTDAH